MVIVTAITTKEPASSAKHKVVIRAAGILTQSVKGTVFTELSVRLRLYARYNYNLRRLKVCQTG